MANKVPESSRRWYLVFNNPSEHGVTYDSLKDYFENKKKNTVYYLISTEVGSIEHTEHYNLYFVLKSPMLFSAVKKKFPTAHIEAPFGTSEDLRNYCFKLGKHSGDDTIRPEFNYEFGSLPVESPGVRSDLDDLYSGILSGLTNTDLINLDKRNMLRLDKINKIRQELIFDKFRHFKRDLSVFYIYGASGTGKTTVTYSHFGFNDVYRVSDYDHPFDSYLGQSVLFLDEYRSQFSLSYLLMLLQGFPMDLKARFYSRVACFTTVVIASNWVPALQYANTLLVDREALWSRVNGCYCFDNPFVADPFSDLDLFEKFNPS